MKIYLIEEHQNQVKERTVSGFFSKHYVNYVYVEKKPKTLFNMEVFAKIKELLDEKKLKGNDFSICIEGGYFKLKNGYFMGDVCGIKDANGIKFGLGNLYEISENMYNAVKHGASLGACIKNVQKTRSFSNRNYSVVEYLTGNTFNRGDGMSVALRNADDAEYNEKPKTVKLIKRLPIKNFYELDKECEKVLREKM